MKTKTIIIIFICAVLTAFSFGATDSVRFADKATGEENSGSDRLIGVFITKEHLDLFDIEGYLEEYGDEIFSGVEISEEDSAKYERRLYATLENKPYTNEETGETINQQEYVFKGVEGIRQYCALFSDADGTYHGNGGDEAISDGKLAINSTDSGESISLEGTIYVSVDGGPDAFYFNPIYQTTEGEVYALAGSGMSYGGDLTTGMTASQTLSEKSTVTNESGTGEVSTDIKINVCYIDNPLNVSVVQFDADSKILSRIEYAAGELPNELNTEAGTEYIIVETHAVGDKGERSTTREMFLPSDETLFAFTCRDDGICLKQYVSIKWAMSL